MGPIYLFRDENILSFWTIFTKTNHYCGSGSGSWIYVQSPGFVRRETKQIHSSPMNNISKLMSSARNFRRSQNVFYERTHPILIRGCVAGAAAAGDGMYDACCLPTANFDLFFGAASLCATSSTYLCKLQ